MLNGSWHVTFLRISYRSSHRDFVALTVFAVGVFTSTATAQSSPGETSAETSPPWSSARFHTPVGAPPDPAPASPDRTPQSPLSPDATPPIAPRQPSPIPLAEGRPARNPERISPSSEILQSAPQQPLSEPARDRH